MSLRLALPRGGWSTAAVRVLERAGYTVDPMRDRWDEAMSDLGDETWAVALEPFDLPGFVATGGADAGLCGRDVLLERQAGLCELLEFGEHEDRLVLAAPAALDRDRVERLGGLRVATRYPCLARRHFAAAGRQVHVLAVTGAATEALQAGLADAVLDLAGEEGVPECPVELEELARCRLRLVVGRAARVLHASDLQRLTARLRVVAAGESGED